MSYHFRITQPHLAYTKHFRNANYSTTDPWTKRFQLCGSTYMQIFFLKNYTQPFLFPGFKIVDSTPTADQNQYF